MRSLRETLENYLGLRRSLGFKMLNESAALPGFLSFVEKRKVSYITTRLALDWAQQGREGQSKWRFSMVRGLAKYAAIFDNRNEVPQLGLLRTKYPRPRPYIYSDDEIERLLCAARNWGHDRPRRTYYSFLGLLAVSGLRLGEAIRLQLDDVDLENGILTIRNSKFGKSRLVPLHSSTIRSCWHVQASSVISSSIKRPSTYFFHNSQRDTSSAADTPYRVQKTAGACPHTEVTSRGGPPFA